MTHRPLLSRNLAAFTADSWHTRGSPRHHRIKLGKLGKPARTQARKDASLCPTTLPLLGKQPPN